MFNQIIIDEKLNNVNFAGNRNPGAPWITCPSNMSVSLPPGRSRAFIKVRLFLSSSLDLADPIEPESIISKSVHVKLEIGGCGCICFDGSVRLSNSVIAS